LPIDETSTYIRSVRAASGNPTDGMVSELGPLGQISRCR
jgi:hypothetical protein